MFMGKMVEEKDIKNSMWIYEKKIKIKVYTVESTKIQNEMQ